VTHTEMEEALQNLDRRTATIEQILPTLATRQDLERFATKLDLRDGITEAKRHAGVLVESVRNDIRIVAEAVATLVIKVDSLTDRVDSLADRVDSLADRVDSLAGRVDSLTDRVDSLSGRFDSFAGRFDSLTRRLETKGVI